MAAIPVNTVMFQAFITVMELESVSRAAEKLYVTQPAITKRIQALEAVFNTQLFEPIGRNVQPTQAAYTLLPLAKKWLNDLETMKNDISYLQHEIAGTLSLGTSHHIGLHYLPDILKTFVQAYPNVQLDVHFVDSEAAHHAVLVGEVELAFLTLPPVQDSRLAYQTLWHDPLVFVCAPFHPLAKQKELNLIDLTNQPAILPAPNTYTSQITLQAFAAQQLKPLLATMSTNPLESIRMLVAVGLGWSVLPVSLVNQDLVILPIKHLELSRNLGLVWHPQRTLSKAAEALRQAILERQS